MKSIAFVGNALEVLRSLPDAVRREAGFQIERLQRGFEPDDWKPMKTIGAGVCEIRLRAVSGSYRVIYVAKFQDAIYVLHVFAKKTQATSRRDLEIANSRYRDLVQRGIK